METLEFIRNAGETRRFHTWPVLRQQNVAEHSWHVTMLLWFIFGTSEPGLAVPMIMAAMCHDMAEWQVGDLPSPAKRRMQTQGFADFREKWGEMEEAILSEQGLDWDYLLDEKQRAMLRLVDNMDGALYCVRERAMGNKLIEPCYTNFISYVEEILQESFPSLVQHGDRAGAVEATPESTRTARAVYNHIKDMWEQANAS
jgi:5'-deoxynucleotidase YfbR-like HD superfamily hydrolase